MLGLLEDLEEAEETLKVNPACSAASISIDTGLIDIHKRTRSVHDKDALRRQWACS